MADYLEITAVSPYTDRDGNKRSSYRRIGTAMHLQNGGMKLIFDALPVAQMNDKGGIETIALALPPKPKDGQQQNRGGGYGKAGPDVGDGDNIPFMTEWR